MIGVVAEKKPWFGPKRFGVGWTATSWQGWVVIALVVGAIVLVTRVIGRH